MKPHDVLQVSVYIVPSHIENLLVLSKRYEEQSTRTEFIGPRFAFVDTLVVVVTYLAKNGFAFVTPHERY